MNAEPGTSKDALSNFCDGSALEVADLGEAVAIYRMYTVGNMGRLVDAEVIYTSSDEEALAIAKHRLKENDLEIWTGTRRVGFVRVAPELP